MDLDPEPLFEKLSKRANKMEPSYRLLIWKENHTFNFKTEFIEDAYSFEQLERLVEHYQNNGWNTKVILDKDETPKLINAASFREPAQSIPPEILQPISPLAPLYSFISKIKKLFSKSKDKV